MAERRLGGFQRFAERDIGIALYRMTKKTALSNA
jgi:hypothetical protein